MINKYYIIVNIIFMFNILPAQDIPRIESGQKPLDCKICHTCDKPTVSNPCLRKCPRFHTMTTQKSPDEVPDVIVINKLSKMYVPVVFSHKLHAQMADMMGGCQICHHHNPKGAILDCGYCHELAPIRADLSKPSIKGAYHRQCLGCHREWSHSTKCVVCHALRKKITEEQITSDTTDIIESDHPPIPEPEKIVYETKNEIGRLVSFYHDEHVRIFGLKCVNCHQKENCRRCHDLTKSSLAEQILPGETVKVSKSLDEHHQACFPCHANEKCSFCHRNVKKQPFNHLTRTGWNLNPYHIGLSCAQCHKEDQTFIALNKNCNNCHQNWNASLFNHAITGLTLDENHRDNACEDCHLDRRFNAKPTCTECHDNEITYPEMLPGFKR